MKTAIYLENGVTQLVLTPENEWEKNAVRCIGGSGARVAIHRGGFYECRGGWVRQDQIEDSLILRTVPSPDVPEELPADTLFFKD